jgi:hypothetical protein
LAGMELDEPVEEVGGLGEVIGGEGVWGGGELSRGGGLLAREDLRIPDSVATQMGQEKASSGSKLGGDGRQLKWNEAAQVSQQMRSPCLEQVVQRSAF